MVVIESGVSDNNNYYPDTVLQESASVFEGRPVAIYAFQGHMGVRYDHRPTEVRRQLPYGVAGNVCGWLSEVRYEVVESSRQKGRQVGAITANLNVTDPWLQQTLFRSWNQGKFDLFELSIEALGPHQPYIHEGRPVHRLEAISTALELTVVRRGAAGGVILELVASDGSVTKEWEQGTSLSPLAHELLSLSDRYPDVPWLELASFIEAGPLKTKQDSPLALPISGTAASESDADVEYKKVIDAVQNALAALHSGKTDKALSSLDDAVALLFNYGQNQLDAKTKPDTPVGAPEKLESTMETEDPTPDPVVESPPAEEESPVEPAVTELPVEEVEEGCSDKSCKCGKASCKECRDQAVKAEAKSEESTETAREKAAEKRDPEKEMAEMKAYRQGVGDMPTPGYNAAVTPPAPPVKTDLAPTKTAKDPNKMVASAKTENVQDTPEIMKEASMEKEESQELSPAVQAELEKMRAREHERELAECRRTLSWELRESGLPEIAQKELEAKYQNRVFDEKELKESVASFRRVIAPLAGQGNAMRIADARGAIIAVGAEKVDRVRADFDRICGFNPNLSDKMWQRDERTGRGVMVQVPQSMKDLHESLPGVPSPARWFAEVFDDPDQLGFGGYAGPAAMVRELMEATTADIPQLLGDSMTRSMVQRYQDADYPWRQLCNIVPVANFRTQRRILFGGLGLLPTTVESDSIDNYETLGLPADEEQTYGVSTRGGLIKVTRRMIINDDLQAIQRMPAEAATSAAMTLTRLVMNILQGRNAGGAINTDVSYDGTVYYHANHFNYGTTAMGYQSFIDSRNRLRRQRRFANVGVLAADMTDVATNMTLGVAAPYAQLRTAVKVGDTIHVEAELMEVTATTGNGANDITVRRGIEGTTAVAHLSGGSTLRVAQLGAQIALPQIYTIYPYNLESNVLQVFNSQLIPGSTNNDVNTIYGEVQKGRIVPLTFHEMFFGGDGNNWFNVAGSPIELGFLGGRENPELFLQDNPLVGDVFLKDTIAWKTRHEYGGVLVDHATVDGNIVAG